MIQAAVGTHIIARERYVSVQTPRPLVPRSLTFGLFMTRSIAPFRKDVTAPLYGGDVTRKVISAPVPGSGAGFWSG